MLYPFGSQLTKKIFPEFRNPKDFDWVTNDQSELKKSNRQEEYYYIPCAPNREMTANELYTLKVSHAIYDIQWAKTMSDIRFFQIKGCEIEKSFLNELREYWKSVHTSKQRTNFEIEENKFFDDNVKREIPHDDLHKIFNPTPAYLNIVDGVVPSEDKFNALSESLKDAVCFEESYVLAVERYCDKLPYRQAYHKAQMDLVTRLHPIWLADYIITNWNKKFWITKNNYYEIYKTRTNRED
jgi:hypothetical protein